MSQPTYESIRIDRDLEMTTRDGVVLRADVIRPATGRVPAIVVRTPYEKTNQFHMQRFLPPYVAAQHGYAMVIQDIRGRWSSEGEWNFLDLTAGNVEDGYDCVEWVAAQPWCDGNVGMAGGSYVAETQMAAAMGQPPSLGCIAPAVMGMGRERALAHDLPLESMTVGWMAGLAVDRLQKLIPTGQAEPGDFATVMQAMARPDLAAQTLPLRDLLSLRSVGMPRYEDTDTLVANTARLKGTQEARFTVPALWTTGWYDNAAGAEQFNAMRQGAASGRARRDTRIIFGAWTHNFAGPFVGALGLGGLGSAWGGAIRRYHLRFYDRHLRGADTDIPVVRYFVMGANTWRDAEDWPIPGTEFQKWYLHSRGRARSVAGDGELSRGEPTAAESPDSYDCDPARPVPSWGFRVMYTGGTTVAGPYEQTRVEKRQDVLVYTSTPVDRPTEVVGDVELHLFASSTAVDTDWVAKLCVVWPDGTSLNLADAALRARNRDGFDNKSLLEPGRVYEFVLGLGPTGYLLEPGMRLRLQVTSSAFPHLARNLNTGEPIGDQVVSVVATNTVFHDPERPSYVLIPVQANPPPPAPPIIA